MKPVTLTAEAAQQIEEALNAATLNKDHWLEKCMDSLDTIRAARAQADHIGKSDEMVKPPQNCGTGYCSCIECVKESATQEPSCSNHPDAPHGFDRNASHNAGRYVCECEGWTPEESEEKRLSYCGASVWVGNKKISIIATEDIYTNTLLCELTQQCLAKISDELRENKN